MLSGVKTGLWLTSWLSLSFLCGARPTSSCIFFRTRSSVSEKQYRAHDYLIYVPPCLVFAHPPLPGVTGCFVVHANKTVIGCWASLIVWNTSKSTFIIPSNLAERSPSHDGAHACPWMESLWVLLYFIFAVSKPPLPTDSSRGNGANSNLAKIVYRDGMLSMRLFCHCWFLLWHFLIGTFYYIYLFCESSILPILDYYSDRSL